MEKMVICCVPKCETNSLSCDSSMTFHEFPSNPDTAAKWIKQINFAIKTERMWIPRGRVFICGKHFLHTDFKDNTDILKPKCVPTVFGHKYIGQNAHDTDFKKIDALKPSPLIVKVNKPQDNVSESSGDFEASAIGSEVEFLDINKEKGNDGSLKSQSKLQQSSPRNSSKNNNQSPSLTAPKQSILNKDKIARKASTLKNASKRSISSESSSLPKTRKKEKPNDLIEIGPNTFLKINPDVIKVNKKLTPSGNTVLQFLMDQKLANSQAGDFLPKLIQGPSSSLQISNFGNATESQAKTSIKANNSNKVSNSGKSNDRVVQHVLGHLVDTHVCEDSCADLKLAEEHNVPMDVSESEQNVDDPMNDYESSQKHTTKGSGNTDASFFEKAPVLLTTNMPISHCFMEKPKYVLQLKQKYRQISALKLKLLNMTKKLEELEDKCVVQERQLSYSFIKRLKTIRKNAAKGDPAATYILEQIRSYPTNNLKMRWSDSTLTQCAIWCRKAPYAYEYFKKADFFKLPCLGTVKRFMKKHPELKVQKKNRSNLNDDGESSSDFDFDESDNQNASNDSDEENNEPVACETVLMVPSEMSNPETTQAANNLKQINKAEDEDSSQSSDYPNQPNVQSSARRNTIAIRNISQSSKGGESNVIPVTVDSSNLELQEIILPSGEVVQCYSSNISNGGEAGGQYFIIPNVGDQNSADNEYSVVQGDSMPVILQNLENSQLHVQQSEQLIFIANSADQVECTETEVSSV